MRLATQLSPRGLGRALTPAAALALVAVCEVLAMATWFSASAVLPALQQRWDLDAAAGSWLTGALQGGFVAGSLTSAALNVPDRFEPRRVIAWSASGAAIANLLLLVAAGAGAAFALRFATGVFLAGVYPVGMKLIATYFERGRGLAIGTLVGALALGSASPHLIRGTLDVPWEGVIAAASLGSLLAAFVVLPVREGPGSGATPRLDLGYVLRALRDRPLRLAIFGYLGHMWELYALWAWMPTFVLASTAAAGEPVSVGTAALASFAAIGLAGLAGAVVAGALADRLGRTAVTSAAMIVSAACCGASVVVYGAGLSLLVALLVVWGASVIADSAQFSAGATELAPSAYSGSALTLQTALGFLLTIASIRVVPEVADAIGWQYALSVLAIGPVLGTIAMLALRRMPEAASLAGGRR